MTTPVEPDQAALDEAAIDQLEKEQAAEYGTWRAIEPIDLEGVRAFNVGHPVPVSHVVKYHLDEIDPPVVERVDGGQAPVVPVPVDPPAAVEPAPDPAAAPAAVEPSAPVEN